MAKFMLISRNSQSISSSSIRRWCSICDEIKYKKCNAMCHTHFITSKGL